MNKKETLIKVLHGSSQQLQEVELLTQDMTIFLESGHVDTDFLQELLKAVCCYMESSNKIVERLQSLMAPEGTILDKKKKEVDNGQKWTVEDILKNCSLEENIIKLPKVQFNKKSYIEAKKWIEEAGGSWQGGKIQGFTFPFDAARVFEILHRGERCNLQQEYQFFETPESLADWLVMLAGGAQLGENILEPSAGRGAIIKAIHRACPGVMVDCFELMPENQPFILKMQNVNLIGEDFTEFNGKRYDKIIANPPFAKNQDIKHVRKMYELLKPGGTVAAITSTHWVNAQEKICCEFREWLKTVDSDLSNISSGEFKESGTTIPTVALVIKK